MKPYPSQSYEDFEFKTIYYAYTKTSKHYVYRVNKQMMYLLVIYTRNNKYFVYSRDKGFWWSVVDDINLITSTYFPEILMEELL